MNIYTSHDFNLTDKMILRYQDLKKKELTDLTHCFSCGKTLPSDIIESGSIICLTSNQCFLEFIKNVMTHEFNRLGLDENLQQRDKRLMKTVAFTNPEFDNLGDFEMEISQGDIVTCTRESDGSIPEYIVVEHVATDGIRQEYLALRNMKTKETISFLDVHGKCTSVRKALPKEIESYNVWITK